MVGNIRQVIGVSMLGQSEGVSFNYLIHDLGGKMSAVVPMSTHK
ncbi:12625_t:CDS:2 [Funneliformis geosporum]|nr:12625_t:CDS:2 [Funneliformis geosporum]